MALIEGKATSKPSARTSTPSDANSIMKRLLVLGQDISACQAEQLELLVRFDDLKGWECSGARHCAAWMNVELGISLQTGWEYLRAGRQLQDLPVTSALFRAGQLSWSKIRLITRVASRENESQLCHCALDASVSQVEQLCNEFRWHDTEDERQAENDRAMKQWEARSLHWHDVSNGNVQISLNLPPETAQAFLKSVEHSLGKLEPAAASMAQQRADVVHQNHSPRGEWSTESAKGSSVAEPLALYKFRDDYGYDPRSLRFSPQRQRDREHLDTYAGRHPPGCTYLAAGRC